jgi:stalled ribosome alternative rescue factor ArfA
VIKNKRGKGSYNRKSKHAGRFENDWTRKQDSWKIKTWL